MKKKTRYYTYYEIGTFLFQWGPKNFNCFGFKII